MFILDEFNNLWNYTFIIVALVAIAIGTFLTLRKFKKEKLRNRRDKRSNND